jgi:hypothetical protein
MQRTPPRHLAPTERTRSPARHHLLAETIIALAAVGLTAAVVLGSVLGGPESSAARLPNPLPVAPTTTRAAATTPGTPKPDDRRLLANAGFEAALAGWRALGGAGVAQVAEGRQGSPALRLTRGPDPWPGARHDQVARVAADRRYEATAWVRASRPGVEVRLSLFELHLGQRFAVGTASAVAGPQAWQQVKLSYDAHQPGAVLAVELLAPDLAGGTSLLLDDLAVRATATGGS